MLILGIETSCDETGVALYDGDARRLLAHAVHSQVAMHEAYGGVVPELASRDHIRRLVAPDPQGPGFFQQEFQRTERHRVHRRPGARRGAPGGSLLRPRPRGRAEHPVSGYSPPRRAPAFAPPVSRAAGFSVRRAAGLRRPYPAHAGRRGRAATRFSARPRTTPRARPSTRPPSSSAWAIRAAPRFRSSPSPVRPGATACPGP